MDLLEYQAKEWFCEMGIPVLPSQRVDCPGDLKGLKIPYPVVLKSQVRAGGRGRAGGVKFVENTIDAIAAARAIFNLQILGEYPKVLLAEAKYDANQELYLAVVLDAAARRPVLLGSSHGGIDVELALDQMQHVVVEQEFSPYYARRLTLKMGLQGMLIQSVSAIVEKMYQLFVQKDLDLVEINPLGVTATGEVMALDGKITVNDGAIARHPDIASMTATAHHTNGRATNEDLSRWQEVENSGNIGVLANGAGLVTVTSDLVTYAGFAPANCLNIGVEADFDPSSANFCERLEAGLLFLTQNKNIKVVLVNLLGGVPTALEVAGAIANFVQKHTSVTKPQASRTTSRTRPSYLPRLVVRLAGVETTSARECLAAVQVPLVENLDEAVAQAVRLATDARKT